MRKCDIPSLLAFYLNRGEPLGWIISSSLCDWSSGLLRIAERGLRAIVTLNRCSIYEGHESKSRARQCGSACRLPNVRHGKGKVCAVEAFVGLSLGADVGSFDAKAWRE